jgi:acyl-CoA synthetase (AMP-forming)/AMP-acid ligase II
MDEGGYVRITGRRKDIIIRKGENLSAKGIEDDLSAHPKVADVAVIGVPDPQSGERVCACVVLRPGADALSVAEVRAFMEGRGVMRQRSRSRSRSWPSYRGTRREGAEGHAAEAARREPVTGYLAPASIDTFQRNMRTFSVSSAVIPGITIFVFGSTGGATLVAVLQHGPTRLAWIAGSNLSECPGRILAGRRIPPAEEPASDRRRIVDARRGGGEEDPGAHVGGQIMIDRARP